MFSRSTTARNRGTKTQHIYTANSTRIMGRQMMFSFVGKTITLTFSQWDVRSRATSSEAPGGGLCAVDIEVDSEERSIGHGVPEVDEEPTCAPFPRASSSSSSHFRPLCSRLIRCTDHPHG
ncbi:hypothetical protein L226DRAFT_344865 [Lentinus tigrinus ALCF2SS1-7]|uniref:uncharacterized protein n=1 Tax=Lentinus tigrinus ALCF2SS1-7 TaxID=1328758 RepID=UPI001165F070|nr:hypothetical protein L226DRAFT_344865 [Lentinus tigrinus ALCF2SS1-7]